MIYLYDKKESTQLSSMKSTQEHLSDCFAWRTKARCHRQGKEKKNTSRNTLLSQMSIVPHCPPVTVLLCSSSTLKFSLPFPAVLFFFAFPSPFPLFQWQLAIWTSSLVKWRRKSQVATQPWKAHEALQWHSTALAVILDRATVTCSNVTLLGKFFF